MLSEAKSTTGRSVTGAGDKRRRTAGGSVARRILRVGTRALGAVSDEAAARAAVRIWFSPPRRAISAEERRVLARAQPLPVEVEGRRVAAWSFGRGEPVFLVHGWGGRAAQLLEWVEPIVAAGSRAILFDALGHGDSAASPLGAGMSSFVEAAKSMIAVADVVGRPKHVVAHSGGAVATFIAMQRGLVPKRLVLVAPFARPLLYAGPFEDWLGLSSAARARFRTIAAARAGFDWEEVDLTSGGAKIDLPPTLVVHDAGDKEVPVVEGKAVAAAWPRSTLVLTQRLGHQRILRDPDVIARGASFLRADQGLNETVSV